MSAVGFTGSNMFTYTIPSNQCDTNSANVTVLVYPTSEWASSVVSARTTENMPVNIPVLANDSFTSGDPLILQVSGGPANGSAAVNLHGNPNDPRRNWSQIRGIGVRSFLLFVAKEMI